MNNLYDHYTYFKNLIKREFNYLTVKPDHALLFITYRCTSRCKMCTIWKRGMKANINEELSLDEWKKFIDMINVENLKVVELFGGDCLLRKDICYPLIEYILKKNKDIIIDLPTNCNLLDKKTAFSLIKAGVGRFYISLDGPINIHDHIRGNHGTYTHVEDAIKYLVEARKNLVQKKPEIIINCTLSKCNIHNFEQIIPKVEELGVDTIEFEYVGEFKKENIQNTNIESIIPTPFYISLGSSNLLNRKEAILLKEKIKKIKKMPKNSKMKIITNHIDSLTIDNFVNGSVPNKKCYACRYMISIDPYGNVVGCFHYNNYIIGNIRESSFSEIWKNKKHHKFLKKQRNGEIKICKNCITGVHRNTTLLQSIYRKMYFNIVGKGFDEP